MKTCFSEEKLFETPPFNEPPISKQFFHEHLFVQILKIRTPPNFRGEKLCKSCGHSVG